MDKTWYLFYKEKNSYFIFSGDKEAVDIKYEDSNIHIVFSCKKHILDELIKNYYIHGKQIKQKPCLKKGIMEAKLAISDEALDLFFYILNKGNTIRRI